ncbi:MAG: tRNA-specific 2-thiouridylase MnmA [Candidatus Moranbacteria bacterium GW2011_GWF2_36_839]|nr:MAG: tRNA-specific 2-thiouridylase MnmA [Candidatus Moranbacteria bacterium GW2011_GWF1_36_78]KKQ16808.1 MAG: tRNA-specific 2-thiouridylase MnmA [Candidatus Moranbacteria bacterium GW2011_GWF2_36_839]HAT73611.1 tRNA 2-thiouridine(34) synthase MnmA [Candidatus Moranbacteria bacterium]HBY10577.1 tRNA 2-thiouridine(34) synthase MnmA [Candidatus Moranbacteria bacterium]
MKKNGQKVLLGMSGGVDSCVSAALLKKQGFDVRGVYLQMWKVDEEKSNKKAIRDAQKIAKILDIPLEIVDVRKKFKKEVVGYFLKEYIAGRTPNPCVFCNENLKFKTLFEIADKLGIDYISTGHYARIIKKKKYQLLEARDKNKDQSYFLYRLKQEQLARIIFPLGEIEKNETRKLAKKFGLPVFDKAESQDICFLANMPVEEFLTKNIKLKKGEIKNTKGEIIGEHLGLSLYTLGQRKGINIGGTGPYYVTKRDIVKNCLVVTNKKEDLSLFSKFVNLEELNWILAVPKFPAKVLARIRYRSSLIPVVIKKQKNGCQVIFDEIQRAVTSGQSIVFYNKKSEILGGGIIK